MSIEHLRDDEIQDFLDQVRQKKSDAGQLQKLRKKYGDDFNKYAFLYDTLGKQPDMELSPDFPQVLMARIQANAATGFSGLWLSIFVAIGFLSGISAICFFWGETIFAGSANSFEKLVQIYSGYFQNLKMSYHLLGAGLIALILMSIFDYFINSKLKIMSLFK